MKLIKLTTVALTLFSIVLLNQSLAAPPSRIVSTNGALTEIVYALQAEAYLVGVDTTSTYPTAAQQLPQVGYQRALSLEGIASLEPDLVLTTQAAGPPLVLQQLDKLGIKQLQLADDYSAEGALQRIKTLASLLEKQMQGEQLISQIEADLVELERLTAQLAAKPPIRVLFLLAHTNTRLASGSGTVADAMIRLAGGQNVVQAYTGYKPLTAEAAAVLNPQVIIAIGMENKAQLTASLAQDQALQATLAMQQQRVHIFDSLYFLGFGPRFAEAAQELATYLLQHP